MGNSDAKKARSAPFIITSTRQYRTHKVPWSGKTLAVLQRIQVQRPVRFGLGIFWEASVHALRNVLVPARIKGWGGQTREPHMVTVYLEVANQYRRQAQQCVELAKAALDGYAVEGMTELAQDFNRAAEDLEHRRTTRAPGLKKAA
jgi:hypothetical protein